MTGAQIAEMVAVVTFTFRDETELQEALGHILEGAGLTVEREVKLNGTDRIDFVVGRVGIEVKVGGAGLNVARQLQRYARSDRIDEILLISHAARHTALPAEIGGKPLNVVWIGGGL